MGTIELDDATHSRLQLVAGAMNVTEAQAVAALMDRLTPPKPGSAGSVAADDVPVHFEYRGQRAEGLYHRTTKGLTITGGPGAGKTYVKPSPAAFAVVSEVAPDVDAHRNGWREWTVTATGQPLQSIRHG